MSLAIRPARAADHAAIARIIVPTIRAGETYALDRDLSEADALAYWTGADRETFVAEADGAVLGTYYLRANQAGGPGVVRRKKDYASGAEYCRALAQFLQEQDIGLIVLAGFMTVLDEEFCKNFENRIINVHPSLIPSFCGDGFYGLHVHEAALAKGVKVTGATVHFVNAITDGGPIIAQKAVAVEPDDTPEILQKRVMAQAEHILLPRAVSLFCEGKLSVSDNGIVSISE